MSNGSLESCGLSSRESSRSRRWLPSYQHTTPRSTPSMATTTGASATFDDCYHCPPSAPRCSSKPSATATSAPISEEAPCSSQARQLHSNTAVLRHPAESWVLSSSANASQPCGG